MKKNKNIFLIIIICCLISCVDWFWVPRHETHISIPYRQAEEPYWCAVACVQMWGLYTGCFFTQSEIASQIIMGNGRTNVIMICWGIYEYTTDIAEVECSDNNTYGQDFSIGLALETNERGHPAILIVDDGNHAVPTTGKGYWYNQISGEIRGNFIEYHDPAWFGGRANIKSNFEYFKTNIYDSYISPALEETSETYKVIYWVATKGSNSSIEEVKNKYNYFLKSCGTYYGGPEIYIPEGSVFVRIRRPNGGNIWALGTIQKIKWESNGLSGKIRLVLLKDGVKQGAIAKNLPIGNGSYDWTVGELLNGTVENGEGYKIKISMKDGSDNDTSNLSFSIDSYMTLQSPSNGDDWYAGNNYTIQWGRYGPMDDNIKITLLDENNSFIMNIAEITPNNGSFEWVIPKAIYYSSYDNGGVCPVTDPNYLLGPVGRTGKYHIRISTIDNEIDITSPIFNIPEERPIILPYAHMVPLEWIAYKGNHWNINWRVCGGMDENVRISLIKNDIEVLGIIDSTPTVNNWEGNGGSYNDWIVPNTLDEGTYSIRIKTLDNRICGSSQDFEILEMQSSEGSITVLSPNGGENLISGNHAVLSWNYTGTSGTPGFPDVPLNNPPPFPSGIPVLVNIVLLKDGNEVGIIGSWRSREGNNYYLWQVGNVNGGTVTPGIGYKIKISSIDGTVYDASNASFSISEN